MMSRRHGRSGGRRGRRASILAAIALTLLATFLCVAGTASAQIYDPDAEPCWQFFIGGTGGGNDNATDVAKTLAATWVALAHVGRLTAPWQLQLASVFTSTNLWLIVINLLPIPPLDGSEAWRLLPRLFTGGGRSAPARRPPPPPPRRPPQRPGQPGPPGRARGWGQAPPQAPPPGWGGRPGAPPGRGGGGRSGGSGR